MLTNVAKGGGLAKYWQLLTNLAKSRPLIWGVQKPPNLFDIICDQPLVRKMMCNYNQDDDRTSLNSVWFKPWTATHHLKTLSLKVKLWIRIWLLIILGFWLAVKVETLTLQRYRAWLSRSWSFSNRIIVLCCPVYETISLSCLLRHTPAPMRFCAGSKWTPSG